MTIPGWLSEWTSPLTAIGGPPKGLLGGLLGGGGGGSSGGPRFWKAEVVQQEAAMVSECVLEQGRAACVQCG